VTHPTVVNWELTTCLSSSAFCGIGGQQESNIGRIPVKDVKDIGIAENGAITVNLKNGDSYAVTSHTGSVSQAGGNLSVTFSNGSGEATSQLSLGSILPEGVGGFAENSEIEDSFSVAGQGDSVSSSVDTISMKRVKDVEVAGEDKSFTAHTNAGRISKAIDTFRELLELEGDENLIKIFDEWEVRFENTSVPAGGRGIFVLAETERKDLKSTFFLDSARQSSDGRLKTVAHEFRHLLSDNRKLYSRRQQIILDHEDRDIEIDAKKWAREFIIRNRRKK